MPLSEKKEKNNKKIKRRGNKSYFALTCIKVNNLEKKVGIDLEKARK